MYYNKRSKKGRKNSNVTKLIAIPGTKAICCSFFILYSPSAKTNHHIPLPRKNNTTVLLASKELRVMP